MPYLWIATSEKARGAKGSPSLSVTRTLIRGGTVVNPTGPQPADVLIDGETIAGVLSPAVAAELAADEVIDAAGCYVIPGGVDAHTHMQMPFGGTTASDTFETGTAAAAWGGTTTIIDFAIQTPGEAVPECLDRWHAKAAGVCTGHRGLDAMIIQMRGINRRPLTLDRVQK